MHKHIRLILPLTLVITSTMLTRQSYADRNREAKLTQAASKELNAGNLAFNSKDYLKAIGHYKSAYRLVPDDQTLYKIASAYDLIPNSCEEVLQTWKKLDIELTQVAALSSNGDINYIQQQLAHLYTTFSTNRLAESFQFGKDILSYFEEIYKNSYQEPYE